jgi:2,6-dihydroxypseudooxynicotine hydrolase
MGVARAGMNENASGAAKAPEDERVTFVKRNWMGRFLRAEVNYGDYTKIADRISTWAQWLPAWAETAEAYEKLAWAAEEKQARHSAAEAWRRAAMCWHFAKFNWLEDIDRAEHAQRRLNDCYDRALWSLKPPGEKVAIGYGRETMAAILRRPMNAKKPPLMIVIGGLDSVKEELQQVADYFLDRGLATLSLDGPGQGETGLSLKIEAASEKPIGAALDFIAGLPDVDSSRVGIYGQSLGGHYVVRAIAFEPRIKAAIASAGPYSIAPHWDQLTSVTRKGYQYRTGAGSEAETLERVGKLDLSGVAERATCPLLIMHGTHDEIVPVADAERIAREAKNPTLRIFKGGNHSLSNRHFEVRTGMADWVAQQLGGQS